MTIGFFGSDHRIISVVKSILDEQNICFSIVNQTDYFYPSEKFCNFTNIDYRYCTLGKHYDKFIKSLYRDFKVPWRNLDADGQFWYFSMKSHFSKVLENVDFMIFSNVPHEGLDIIIAEIIEEKGGQWYAPLQRNLEPISFQIFENGFNQIRGIKEIEFSTPTNSFVGLRYKKENKAVNVDFQKKIHRSSLREKLIEKLHRTIQKIDNTNFEDHIHDADVRGIVALHMQPELNTEPLAELMANPITLIEKLINMFPDVHWTIKEHPDQSSRFRGKYFACYIRDGLLNRRFSYLGAKTKLDLSEFSLVATINGTIGTEALARGIPVVCHKSAHYFEVPGSFDVNADTIYQNPDFLKMTVGPLRTAVLNEGVTDPYYLGVFSQEALELGWLNFLRKINVL
jgi:hypothetical protein